MRRFVFVLCLVPIAASCGHRDEIDHSPEPELVEVQAALQPAAWRGLLKPTAIHVAPDDRVHVADNGDMTIKVFDSLGVAITQMGGKGSGPGEFTHIQDFATPIGRVLVFDATVGRLVVLSEDGAPLSVATVGNQTEVMGLLGDDKVILASNAQWSAPLPAGREAWPLAQVHSVAGVPLFEIGKRLPSKNLFVAHIANFVLPAGTRDGRFVWLAYLNSPDVLLYSVADGTSRRITRTLPFELKQLPDDFMPTPPPAGSKPTPLFDAVSIGVATDSIGRAFILTAMGHTGAENAPAGIAVDVLSPDSTVQAVRYRVDGAATHISVSPDGRRVYLLSEPVGTIRMFRLP